jgi:hypothetical protein
MLAALILLSAANAWSAAEDGITLSVSHGTPPGAVLLDWDGGAPPFVVYRSIDPAHVAEPANQVGQTAGMSWTDQPPATSRIFFYVVLGPVCPPGQIACANGCVDPASDPGNCGGCGIACDDGSTCTRDLCAAGTCRHVDRRACANVGEGCGPQGCSACGFAESYPGCANPDSDGDGLSDTWEDVGWIDADCNGILDSNDVALPDANRRVKDVYLKIAAMDNSPIETGPSLHVPSEEAIERVVAAFAGSHLTTAPVRCDASSPCPMPGFSCSTGDFVCLPACQTDADCPTGVCVDGLCRQRRLHLDAAGIVRIPHRNVLFMGPVQPACLTGGDVSQGIDFYDIKAAHFDAGEALFKHFGVFGHFQSCDSTGTCADQACVGVGGTAPDHSASGIAEVYGNDWAVTLGGFPFAPDDTVRELREAGAMMHELGHNLGLHHGGPTCDPPTDPNCAQAPLQPHKVNFISVMNPMYNFGIPVAGAAGSVTPSADPSGMRIDFSHVALPTLSESSLSEALGVSPGNPPYDTDLVKYFSPGFGAGTRYGSTLAGQPINWKVDDPILTTPVQVNINDDPPGSEPFETMPGADDFGGLKFSFQCQPTFENGATPGDAWAAAEIDPQTAVMLDVLLPPAIVRIGAPPCIDISTDAPVPVHIYGSASFNVLKIDLATLRLAEAPPVSTSVADVDGDGYLDLKANFRSTELVLQIGDTRAVTTGKLLDVQSFQGEDTVQVAGEPGACSPVCQPGTADCNGDPQDGCETNLVVAQTNSPDLFGGGDVPAGYTRVAAITHCGACNVNCDDGNACTTDLCVRAAGAGACRHFSRAMCAFDRCSAGAPGSGYGDPACSGPDSDMVLIAGSSIPAPDGLPDAWETPQPDPYTGGMNERGVDVNCDGVIDGTGPLSPDLPLPDSDPVRPDVYVAYDYMPPSPGEISHKPLDSFDDKGPGSNETGERVPGAIERAAGAFAAKGIALHLEVNIDRDGQPTSTDDPATTPTPHHLVVTFCPDTSLASTPDAITFDALKAAHFDSRRRFTHRYTVFGHFTQCAGPGDCQPCTPAFCGPSKWQASGMAELGGQDFMVTLGGPNYPFDLGTTVRKDTVIRYQSGTLVHELGHTIGLNHGGASDPTAATCSTAPDQSRVNHKPNHVSVMNYRYQFTGINTAAFPGGVEAVPAPWSRPGTIEGQSGFIPLSRCDFSTMALPPLDEHGLDESMGVSDCAAFGLREIIQYSVVSPTGFRLMRGPGCGPVDWNGNLLIDRGLVQADINAPDFLPVSFEQLEGFDDWTFLYNHLPFQCGTSFTEGEPAP